jgi:hypothetical protein
MIRYMVLGYLDHDAVYHHKLVVRKPLDKGSVERLVQEMGEVSTDGGFSVGGHAFFSHDGEYLTFPAPVNRRKAIDFIVRLAQETGCDIADIELGQLLTPEDFRNHCELMASLVQQTPNPFGK